MQFIKVHSSTKRGYGPEPILVDASDISTVRTYDGNEAKSIINLKSTPNFPVWACETRAEVETMLKHLGADVVPHG